MDTEEDEEAPSKADNKDTAAVAAGMDNCDEDEGEGRGAGCVCDDDCDDDWSMVSGGGVRGRFGMRRTLLIRTKDTQPRQKHMSAVKSVRLHIA